MHLSRSYRRNRLIAFIAAFAMIVVISGFTAHGFSSHGGDSDHCDWSVHFTGVAGSAPKPAPIARPVLAAWIAPSSMRVAAPSARRLRAHLARGPPALS
jgi:hypothetical protein